MSSVLGAIREVAVASPDAVAVSSPDGDVGYADLLASADAVAGALRAVGVRQGDVVAMSLSRPNLPSGVLGILAAGAAYLPIDDAVSTDLVQRWFAECSVSVVLTDREPENLPRGETTVVMLDQVAPAGTKEAKPATEASPDALAYVVPTSGTSRQPKLVAVGHRGLVSHMHALRKACELTQDDRVLQFHNMSFDAAAEELYPTFAAGATLVPIDAVPAPHELLDLCLEHKISVLNLPTSYWHQLAAEPLDLLQSRLASVRLVVIGGETVEVDVVTSWVSRLGIPLLNTYGVTEVTITSTSCIVDPDAAMTEVPIGSPIEGTTTRVMDDALNPVAPGESGELCVGGDGVAWGYLGEAGLTADKFRPDPLSATPGGRLYRSGDVCVQTPDGQLLFRGRRDFEVKVRGFRVDLSAVEAELTSSPQVSVATVMPSARLEGQLVAYVVPAQDGNAPLDADQLREHLAERLPAWSVPQVFTFLDAFPLTSHGKVDRAALSALDGDASPSSDSHVSKDGERADGADDLVATAVEKVWREVLGVSALTAQSNFFEVGGHSLLAFRVLNGVRRQLAVDVPAATLFDSPLLGDFIAEVEALKSGSAGR